MATIRIKNIGPIADTGEILLTSVMLIIGKQSSGKSTFLKILCFCRWLEKLIMVSGEEKLFLYTHDSRFLSSLKVFHRFNDSFFSQSSYIRYDGDAIEITMDGLDKDVSIRKKPDFEQVRYNSKLCFIPSERNLVSAVKKIDQSYRSSELDVLFNYIFEWGEAKESYTPEHPKRLSFTKDMEYVNDAGQDFVRLVGEDKMLPSYYASSGVQSAMPLDVMVDFYTQQVGRKASVSKHDLNKLLDYMASGSTADMTFGDLKNRMSYQSVQLFIEEPEQNLYPDSQRDLILATVRRLKEAMNRGKNDSLLVMTTHSPYMLSTLNVLLAEAYAKELKKDSSELDGIIHQECLLHPYEYSAFYINDNGVFENVIDRELYMISGVELDGVSDWVDGQIARIYRVLYGED